jgi:hypothetical protein
MSTITIEQIENACFQALTGSPDEYLSQYEIFNYVLDKYDIKNPTEREYLKIRFMMVLRCIHNTFDYINYMLKNDIIYVSYSPDDFDEKNGKTVRVKEIEIDNVKISEKDTEQIDGMPKDIEVINFILDQNLTDYLGRKSENGNTILHSLVISSDYDRIKKHFDKLEKFLFVQNDKGNTPLDYIKDPRINTIFIVKIMNHIKILEQKNEINKNRLICLEQLMSTNNVLLNFIIIAMIFFIGYMMFI